MMCTCHATARTLVDLFSAASLHGSIATQPDITRHVRDELKKACREHSPPYSPDLQRQTRRDEQGKYPKGIIATQPAITRHVRDELKKARTEHLPPHSPGLHAGRAWLARKMQTGLHHRTPGLHQGSAGAVPPSAK